MFNEFDSKIRLSPMNNILWEPMWKISTIMSEVEQKFQPDVSKAFGN